MRFLQVTPCPASLTDEEFRANKDEIINSSDTVAGAIFGGADNHQTGAVCFCGVNERFRTISLLRHMPFTCAIVQDHNTGWFTGSDLCAPIDDVLVALRAQMPYVQRWVFFGQSSGGYTALYASRFFATAAAVAFSPQSFDDGPLQKRMGFPPGIKKSWMPQRIRDLRDVFEETKNQNPAIIVSSINERENPVSSFVWLDHMHWGRLVDYEFVRVFIMNSENHSLLFKKGRIFAEILVKIALHPKYTPDELGWLMSSLLYARPTQEEDAGI